MGRRLVRICRERDHLQYGLEEEAQFFSCIYIPNGGVSQKQGLA